MSEAPSDAKRRRPLWRWLVNLLLLVAVFALVQWWQTRPLASGPAPALQGRAATGERLDLQALRGQTVLVHFWASWCPVCRAEQDNIQAVAADFPVISVAMQSGDEAEVLAFMKQERVGFSTIADPKGEIAGDWGVSAVPASFVVDATGTIRYQAVGYTTEAGLRARLWAADRR
jgi:DsbE subfamily thiol:disulfide oxidoreductase